MVKQTTSNWVKERGEKNKSNSVWMKEPDECMLSTSKMQVKETKSTLQRRN